MSANQQQQPQGPYSSQTDLNVALMIGVGGFLIYILLMMTIKFLAFLSPYFYYVFAMPVYAFAKSGVVAAIIVLMYALIAFAIAFFVKATKGKVMWSAVTYGVFWIVVAAGELVMFKTSGGHVSTPLTGHIGAFCDPMSKGIGYITTCRNTIEDVRSIPVTTILFLILVPNLVFGIGSIFNIISNYASISKHPKKKAKERIDNVGNLINTVAPFQPHLLIYKNLDPNLVDYNSGQLRFMDSPRRYCFENDIVSGFVRRPSKYDPSSYKKFNDADHVDKNLKFIPADKDDYVPKLDEKKFEEVMMRALGDVFTSIDALTPTQTAVLGIVLPLTCRSDLNMDEDQAGKILKQTEKECAEIFKWAARDIATTPQNKLDFGKYTGMDDLRKSIDKWKDHDIAKRIFKNHAYTNTIILRCLTDAKKLGVFQPSTLRWLLFYDRPLFAVIQNESRPSVFAENAATSSHYYVELKAGKKIYKPNLQIAYDGFMENLRMYKYPERKVLAWEKYKRTGDASDMKKEKMVSSEFKKRA